MDTTLTAGVECGRGDVKNQNHITEILMNWAKISARIRPNTWEIWHLGWKSFMPENYTVHENNCDRVGRRSERWKMATLLPRRRRENWEEINRQKRRGSSLFDRKRESRRVHKIGCRNQAQFGWHCPPFTTHSQLSLCLSVSLAPNWQTVHLSVDSKFDDHCRSSVDQFGSRPKPNRPTDGLQSSSVFPKPTRQFI